MHQGGQGRDRPRAGRGGAMSGHRGACTKTGSALRLEFRDWEVEERLQAVGGQSIRRARPVRHVRRSVPPAVRRARRAQRRRRRWRRSRRFIGGRSISSRRVRRWPACTGPDAWRSSRAQPTIMLDGAHNPAAAEALAEALREFFLWDRLHLVISVSGNKNLDGIVGGARPADRCRLRRTEPERTQRRRGADRRAVAAPGDVGRALRVGRRRRSTPRVPAADGGDLILVTGSLYTVADAQRALGLPSLRGRSDMTIESTLLIVKPDGVQRGLVGEVLRRVEAKGLTIEELELLHDPARDGRGALRRASREAVLRRAGGLHHGRPGRWWRRSPARTPSAAGAR